MCFLLLLLLFGCILFLYQVGSDGSSWVSGFFDRGSYQEYLSGWGKSVVVGRARSAASPWGSSTWRHASASRCGRVCGVDDVDEVVRGKRAVRKKTPVGEKEVNTRGLLEREPLGSDKPERAVGERSPSERKTRDISVGERGP